MVARRPRSCVVGAAVVGVPSGWPVVGVAVGVGRHPLLTVSVTVEPDGTLAPAAGTERETVPCRQRGRDDHGRRDLGDADPTALSTLRRVGDGRLTTGGTTT